MKRVLLASAGVLAMAWATTAGAADLPRRTEIPTKAPAYLATVYNWTGLYLGINGGGAWGRSGFESTAAPTGSFNVSGGLVGGTLGYNWQVNQAVFGLETDLDWTNIKGSSTVNCPTGCQTKNTWLGTTRARLGFAAGNGFLPYLTGGVAYGDIKASVPGFAGASSTKAGWTVGAGLEFAVAGNWTAKAEYLYVDLGKMDCGALCGTAAPDPVKFNANILRAGLNYRF
jgi:outer membrane immunogenic protein